MLSPTSSLDSFNPISSSGMLQVRSYSPVQGTQGDRLRVYFDFQRVADKPVYIRLVFGKQAAATDVKSLGDHAESRNWKLEAPVPAFERTRASSLLVPVTIQAMTKDNHIVDSLTFGTFEYPDSGSRVKPRKNSSTLSPSPSLPYSLTLSPSLPSISVLPSLPIRSTTGSQCSSSVLSAVAPPTRSSQGRPQRSRKRNPYVLRRKRSTSGERNESDSIPKVEFATPYKNLAEGWSEAEMRNSRRLVRFYKVHEGNKIIVSCEAVEQEDYQERDIVISCIHRDDTGLCVFTSVDIIYLLENIVDCEFEVAEKNRIRRNLEGLRPKTVCKERPESEALYHRIMEFPDPQPRKIEKSLKVFAWEDLGEALDKIISKYALYSSLSEDRHNFEPQPCARAPSISSTGSNEDAEYCELQYPTVGEGESSETNDEIYLSRSIHGSPCMDKKSDPSDTDMMLVVQTSSETETGYFPRLSAVETSLATVSKCMEVSDSSNSLDNVSTPATWMSPVAYNSDIMTCDDLSIGSVFPLASFDSAEFALLREHHIHSTEMIVL